ncbi:hypothetical protein QVA66_06270 [Staphylococcus chromogenes]|nr:hypothetical protein [Staphylococcus chromogenes]
MAKELKAKGVGLVINTIGFNVDDAARQELQCIAQVAGGKYADVSDTSTLTKALTDAKTRTANRYENKARQLNPTPKPDSAPVVDFQSEETVTVRSEIRDGENYFKLTLKPGERCTVALNTIPNYEGNEGLSDYLIMDTQFVDAQGEEVTRKSGAGFFSEGLTFTRGTGAISKDYDASQMGDSLFVRVKRSANYQAPDKYPVEMTFRKIAPLAPGAETPTVRPSASSKSAPLNIAGKPREVPKPGLWFDEATALEPNQPVTSTVVSNEMQFYKVRLTEGQSLHGLLRVDEFDDKIVEDSGNRLSFKIYSPDRILSDHKVQALDSLQNGKSESFTSVSKVDYANTFDADAGLDFDEAALWAPGEYFVAVHYAVLGSRDDYAKNKKHRQLKYSLVAQPVGQPQQGPKFATDTAATTKPETTQEANADEAEDGPNLLLMGGIAVAGLALLGIIVASVVALVRR